MLVLFTVCFLVSFLSFVELCNDRSIRDNLDKSIEEWMETRSIRVITIKIVTNLTFVKNILENYCSIFGNVQFRDTKKVVQSFILFVYTFCRDTRTINVGNLFFGQRFRSSLVDNLESQTRLTHIKLELQFHSNKLMNVYFVPLIALFVRTLQILLASRLENRADER